MFGQRHGMPRGGTRYGHGSRVRQPYVIILALKLLQTIANLPQKPPLTLALMAGMTALYLKPDVIVDLVGVSRSSSLWPWIAEGKQLIQGVCLKPDAMISDFERSGQLDIRRLLMSAFVHADSMHLYYNMASFLWKGVSLEFLMGSQSYGVLLLFSLVTSQTLLLLMSWVLAEAVHIGGPMRACTVGFSGVLFALKYVLSRRSPGTTKIVGLTINTRYAAWAELLLISIMVPNASFLGHLCGILAGVLYERLWTAWTHPGPRYERRDQRTSYTYSRGTAGAQAAWQGPPQGASAPANFEYDVDDTEERELREAIKRSLQDGGQGGGMQDWVSVEPYVESPSVAVVSNVTPSAPPIEEVEPSPPGDGDRTLSASDPGEVRRRRLQRFGLNPNIHL